MISSLTGPQGGLASVNQTEKHLSAYDPEINFIDNLEDESSELLHIELIPTVGYMTFLNAVYHILEILFILIFV